MKLFRFSPSIKKAKKIKQKRALLLLLCSVIIQLRAHTALPAFTPLTPLLAKTPLASISCCCAQLTQAPQPSHVRRPDVKALSCKH